MKVVVEDANVLLDLVNGGILALWLGAGFENCTTHFVWQELAVTAQRQYVQPFVEAGLLQLEDVFRDWWSEILRLSYEMGISITDSSVWILARERRAILLTGDSKLRCLWPGQSTTCFQSARVAIRLADRERNIRLLSREKHNAPCVAVGRIHSRKSWVGFIVKRD
jgi:hypothetical protein